MSDEISPEPLPDEEDPKNAESTDVAVFIGQQATGDTVVIGREWAEEWLVTADMSPVDLEEVA